MKIFIGRRLNHQWHFRSRHLMTYSSMVALCTRSTSLCLATGISSSCSANGNCKDPINCFESKDCCVVLHPIFMRFYRSCTFLLSYRAEAPTLRMSSGQISITFPIRVGAQVAAVKSEILRQLKRVTADNGTLSVQVSTCLSIHTFRPHILHMMAELLTHSCHPAALLRLQRPFTVCALPPSGFHWSLSANFVFCSLKCTEQTSL